LTKVLADEIALKKRNILKENGAINVLGLANKPSIKEVKN
jgi:transposase